MAALLISMITLNLPTLILFYGESTKRSTNLYGSSLSSKILFNSLLFSMVSRFRMYIEYALELWFYRAYDQRSPSSFIRSSTVQYLPSRISCIDSSMSLWSSSERMLRSYAVRRCLNFMITFLRVFLMHQASPEYPQQCESRHQKT